MMKNCLCCLIAALGASAAHPILAADHSSQLPGPWVSDQGDGTYKNPVLWADYSDPDAILVGDDYYLISSSFTNAPALPVLHSKDLVNWTILTYALPRLVPDEHFAVPRPGEGVWAPSIRHHGGKFYIFYPDPDFGIYQVSATDPAGPWSAPVMVKAVKGYIDPCPFWDDDGSAWLIHGFAKSRIGFANVLSLHRMSPDGTKLLDDGQIIIKGDDFKWTTLEGPKLYKRDGWYYVFAPAGGVAPGFQTVLRSKNVRGPYEGRITLEQGSTATNGPHQGAWVGTPSGKEDWFLHFQDAGAYGRITHLEPMVWKDGWPVMGDDPDGKGTGQPVARHTKPDVGAQQPIAVPQTSDEFDGPNLGLAWQWQANPQEDWTSFTARAGWLRLACVPTPQNLYQAPNLLTAKLPAPEFSATTRLEFAPAADGDAAGLFITGYSYTWIGLRKTAAASDGPSAVRLCLISRMNASQAKGGKETEIAGMDLPMPAANAPAGVFLRVTVQNGDLPERPRTNALCTFSYSLDGTEFKPLKSDFVFNAEVGRWVGAKMGLFAGHLVDGKPSTSQPDGVDVFGHADFDWFRVTAAEHSSATP